MKNAWIAEVWRHGSFRKRRKFTSRDQAARFANDWHDDHYAEDGWDVQIITPAGLCQQTNTNGNERES